jgi:hypothetical protein
MKKYLHISMDTAQRILECFVNDDDSANFIENIEDLVNELSFVIESCKRAHNDTLKAGLAIKEICVLALFFREHIEVMHQIIKTMHLEEVSEEEFNKLRDL